MKLSRERAERKDRRKGGKKRADRSGKRGRGKGHPKKRRS